MNRPYVTLIDKSTTMYTGEPLTVVLNFVENIPAATNFKSPAVCVTLNPGHFSVKVKNGNDWQSAF